MESYTIEWADSGSSNHGHQIICESRSDDLIEENNDIEDEEEYLVGEEIIPSTEIITISNSLDQIAAENLIYMAQDGSVAVMGDLIEEQVEQVDNADYNEQQYFECQVTEEVITDDWVQQQGEDRVEVPVDQLVSDSQNEEVMVPLPTDEYTTSRPYPCDFCSRRFRKKANLMNHMMAHKNDRPHICNLCGARYIRKLDLLNHLKVHAQMPDTGSEYRGLLLHDDNGTEDTEEELILSPPVRKPTRQRKKASPVVRLKKESKDSKKSIGQNRVKYTDDVDGLLGAAQQHEHYYEQHNQSSSAQTRYPVTDAVRPFVCQVCGVGFAREKALLSHVLLHGVDNPLECDSCNETFWTMDSLQEHQNLHHADGSSGSEYEPEKNASDDESDSKFGDYYCNICGMSFHRIDLLKRHTRTHKQTEATSDEFHANEQHCCNVCGNTFAEALDLLAHAEIHTRVVTFKCTLCGESFMVEQNIRQHITDAHAKELTEHTCRLCGKHCKDERTLIKHAWDHSKEKNHSCIKCGKTFYNKARLKRHMQSHRNKSVTCNICGESFPDGRSLGNHRHSHTNVSGRQFPCRECGKTFGSRSSQQIHMRIHTGERPYGCRFCWKAFADGGTLRKHERIHTGEKPYACPICPRAFNQRVVLREHIRSHHSGADPSYENTLTPYYCTVCGNTFKTPSEIIQHLIEHSDANTVSKRQPTLGPRKYKRRRKLKPDELERLRKEDPDYENSPTQKKETRKRKHSDRDDLFNNDDSDDNESYTKYSSLHDDISYTTRSTRERNATSSVRFKSESSQNDSIDSVLNSLDNALNDIVPATVSSTSASSKRTSAKSPNKKQQQQHQRALTTAAPKEHQQLSRPRMIYTKKKVVAAKDGRGKTKTLITRSSTMDAHTEKSTYSKKKAAKKSTKKESKSLTNGSTKATKNNFDNQQNATHNNLLLELSKKSVNYSPDVVSDLEEILRSPIKSRETRSSQSDSFSTDNNDPIKISYSSNYFDASPPPPSENKPTTRSSKRLSNRNLSKEKSQTQASNKSIGHTMSSTIKAPSSSPDIFERGSEGLHNIAMNIKQEKEVSYEMTTDDTNVYTCEMCSAVFSDRAQLLVHVPIHI